MENSVASASNSGFIGTIDKYVQGNDVNVYCEMLENLFEMNFVTEDKRKKVLFLGFVGEETYKVLKSAVHPDSLSAKTYAQIIAVFKAKFAPRHSVIAERFKFYVRDQRPNECITDYVIELQMVSEKCAFGDFLPWALRDRLVMGLKERGIQEKLMSLDGSFEESLKVATSAELTRTNVDLMNAKVDSVHGNQLGGRSKRRQNWKSDKQGVRERNHERNQSRGSQKQGEMRRKKVQCYRCHQWGDHFAANCPQKRHRTRVNCTEQSSDTDESDSYGVISSMFINSVKEEAANVMVTIQNKVPKEADDESHAERAFERELHREDDLEKHANPEGESEMDEENLLESESLEGEVLQCNLEEEELLLEELSSGSCVVNNVIQ
ncbi:uncharacterized protein LOC129808632 [Phlebotomus papatasi]|uniref:uncharacterized protein LOC129808632 n=1 Tax=Phlebotomus papatasi TaxID=29031 RepID=UPI00248447B3|nr:uncharacterized protein LOC129808632 [Phlebotomus papatasi]